MPVDFGWVIQNVPRPGLEQADLLAYNRASIQELSQRFTTVWMEDHFQVGDRPVLEAWATLAFFAAEFPDLKFGHIVLGQSYRNPALTAKMAATLQYLTGGRYIMGIGAGWKEDEYQAYGYPFPSAGVRVAQLEETIAIFRALWTQASATFHGEHYHIENAVCEPRPNPMIPLHIGGGGERATLRVVARHADAWNGNFMDADAFAHKLDVLRGHCREIGRNPDEIALTYYGYVDLPDDPAQFTQRDFFVIGPTPAAAIEQLHRFVDLGVSHILIRSSSLDTLRRFRDEVVPLF